MRKVRLLAIALIVALAVPALTAVAGASARPRVASAPIAATGASTNMTGARRAICGFSTTAAIGGPRAIAIPQRHGLSGTSKPTKKPQANHVVRYGKTAMLPFGSVKNGSLDTTAPKAMQPTRNHR